MDRKNRHWSERSGLWGLSMIGLAWLVACGANEGSGQPRPSESVPTGVRIAELLSDLPNCNPSRHGGVYYVEQDGEYYYCDGNSYRLLDVVGEPGADGIAWLVMVSGASLSQCEHGGIVIEVGPDGDGNSLLDPGEVVSIDPVCNGQDGQNGQDGEDGQDGAEGPPGPPGSAAGCNVSSSPSGVVFINCADGSVAALNDADADGVPDGVDTCPTIANPFQGPDCCTSDADCDDGDECTSDTCKAGECTNTDVALTCADLSDVVCASDLARIPEQLTLCIAPQSFDVDPVEAVLCDTSTCADGVTPGCTATVQRGAIETIQNSDASGATILKASAQLSVEVLGEVTASITELLQQTCNLSVTGQSDQASVTLRTEPALACGYAGLAIADVDVAAPSIIVELDGGSLCDIAGSLVSVAGDYLADLMLESVEAAVADAFAENASATACAVCDGYCDGELVCGSPP